MLCLIFSFFFNLLTFQQLGSSWIKGQNNSCSNGYVLVFTHDYTCIGYASIGFQERSIGKNIDFGHLF